MGDVLLQVRKADLSSTPGRSVLHSLLGLSHTARPCCLQTIPSLLLPRPPPRLLLQLLSAAAALLSAPPQQLPLLTAAAVVMGTAFHQLLAVV
jgi:hypothetical protein